MTSPSFDSRAVNTTNRIAPGATSPRALKRSSSFSWIRSLRDRIHGSSKTRVAVSNRMPCLRRFSRLFAGSHSNRHTLHYAFYSECCAYNCQYRSQLMPQMQVASRIGDGGRLGSFALSRLVQIDVGVEWGVFAGVAYVDYEFAGVDGPLLVWLVPVAEGAGVES